MWFGMSCEHSIIAYNLKHIRARLGTLAGNILGVCMVYVQGHTITYVPAVWLVYHVRCLLVISDQYV